MNESYSSIEGTGEIHHVLSLSRRFFALTGLLLAFCFIPNLVVADDSISSSRSNCAVTFSNGLVSVTAGLAIDNNENITDGVVNATTGEIADINVYAVYKVNFYVTRANGTLTASVDNMDIESGAVVMEGENVVFTAKPASNYRVRRWTLNGVPVSGNTTNSFTLSNIVAPATVTVEFEVITTTYNLNIGTFNGGSVTSTKCVYLENESVTLTIIPDAGFELYSISAYRTGAVNDSISLKGSGNSCTFTMPTYDVTLTAIFITAYDPTGNDLIFSCEDLQTLRVWAQNGRLHVSGLTPWITWRVYSLSGVLVYQSVATIEKAEVQLPVRGVYVVTNGKKTVKVVISD